MCGRYYVGEDTKEDICRIAEEMDRNISWSDLTERDVYPSDKAVIITAAQAGPELSARLMRWGFPSVQKNQLLINARSETAEEKRSFAKGLENRRCIIPAGHFYEWDKERNKSVFSWDASRTLYMAGFYERFNDGDHFIILTTAANESMKPVHDRMPLILQEDQVEDWIRNKDMIRTFLKQAAPILTRVQAYEQVSLFQWMK